MPLIPTNLLTYPDIILLPNHFIYREPPQIGINRCREDSLPCCREDSLPRSGEDSLPRSREESLTRSRSTI